MNSKYNWNEIVKDSKKIIRDTTKNGNRKLISTMKELYDRLKFQYEKKGKEVPRYVLYSEKIRTRIFWHGMAVRRRKSWGLHCPTVWKTGCINWSR